MLTPDGMVVLVFEAITVPCIFFPFNAQLFTAFPLLPNSILSDHPGVHRGSSLQLLT